MRLAKERGSRCVGTVYAKLDRCQRVRDNSARLRRMLDVRNTDGTEQFGKVESCANTSTKILK
jgi:hypothetical protein